MMFGEQILKFKPWLYFDEKEFAFKIKDEAPEEIKKEYEKFVKERW